MSTQIDFRTLPISVPSLCIPRVFVNIDEKRIRRIFDELNMGEIQRIDVVCKTTEKGEKFNRVFVHFKQWFSNENSDTARERLLNGKEIKIIYDDPWFWKVSAYREANKAPPRPSTNFQKKPSLQFDSDEDRQISSSNNYDQRPREDSRRPREDNRRPREDNRRPREDNRRPREDNRRPREDNRRPREEVKKVAVPRSPSNSPPRRRVQEDGEISE